MWIQTYPSALSSSPIATLVASVCVLCLSASVVLPAISWAYCSLWSFWSKGSVKVRNKAYMFMCGGPREEIEINYHYMRGLKVTEVEGGYHICANGNEYITRTGDYSYYKNNECLFESKEQAEALLTSLQYPTSSYAVSMIGLAALSVPALGTALLLDYLVLNHLLPLIVSALVISAVLAVLYGGRFVFSVSKKLEKLDKETEESK